IFSAKVPHPSRDSRGGFSFFALATFGALTLGAAAFVLAAFFWVFPLAFFGAVVFWVVSDMGSPFAGLHPLDDIGRKRLVDGQDQRVGTVFDCADGRRDLDVPAIGFALVSSELRGEDLHAEVGEPQRQALNA